MKYTKELLEEILKEGDAICVEEYDRYNQRLKVKFQCKCGEEAVKKFEMLYNYRYPYCETCSLKIKSEKCKQTCLEKYGVENAAMTAEVREKIEKTYMDKYGGHPKRTKEVQDKWKKTCEEKYGGHPNQNREVQEKAEKNSYKFRDYLMPSGKIIKIQGFEDACLDALLKEFEEEDIICGRSNVPTIPYYIDNEKHIYFPDFYIKLTNTIIEVKSEWTIKQPRACIEEKKQGVLDNGYNFEVWLYNSKKKLLGIEKSTPTVG